MTTAIAAGMTDHPIKTFLEAAGVSGNRLAKTCKVSQSSISCLVSGARRRVDAVTAQKIVTGQHRLNLKPEVRRLTMEDLIFAPGERPR